MDFPFADVLRNPSSILPRSWKIEGRKYLDDLPANSPPAEVPASQSPVAPLPAAPAPPAYQAPDPAGMAPPASLAPPADLPAIDLPAVDLPAPVYPPSELPTADLLSSLVSPIHAPLGVPPASAAEEPFVAMSGAPGALISIGGGGGGGGGGVSLLDMSGLHDASLMDQIGFAAIGDGGFDAGGVIATVACAALGALSMEYIATNKEAPIPDPLLGGLWSSLHAAARFGSKLVGKAAGGVRGVLPF